MKLVRDLMHIGVPTCAEDTPLMEAIQILLADKLEALVVLDSHGHAAGVLNRADVVAAFARLDKKKWEALSVAQVMHPDYLEIPSDIPATAALQIMLDRGVREAYLMHHDRGLSWPAAVLRFDDVLRYMVAPAAAESKASRQALLEKLTRPATKNKTT